MRRETVGKQKFDVAVSVVSSCRQTQPLGATAGPPVALFSAHRHHRLHRAGKQVVTARYRWCCGTMRHHQQAQQQQ